ncbi:MAG: phenylalanine--tRNA ligase subunit beta [Pseudomonadota bacterium]|nr:phenylalanine--tRNA ligase subunit beta [Pseudomonadota bacterium]
MLVLNEYWIQSWLDQKIDADQSHEFLLKQGFEMESLDPIYTTGILIGEIVAVDKHPDADKLNICQVSIGEGDPLQIVCGCSSVAVGVKVAVATEGIELGDFKIAKRKLRGVDSCGMLCSQSELGFKTSSSGIWHLNKDAPVGVLLDVYLQRSDSRYGIDITPNRGDCMSLRGVVREFAIGLQANVVPPWDVISQDFLSLPVRSSIDVSNDAKAFVDMFHLVCLEREQTSCEMKTPDWIQVRLIEAGFGLHHCVVDILNYVMLETGQPMHAYGSGLTDEFSLQMGHDDSLELLNGEEVSLDENTLVISNAGKPACIAGYMGGQDSACQKDDVTIYLEAAAFDSAQVAYHCRKYVDHTQSGSRFERGIDFNFTKNACQRAIDLLVKYAGFKPLYRIAYDAYDLNDKKRTIDFSVSFPEKVLGFSYPIELIESSLKSSGCAVSINNDQISVTPPTWRNDLKLPETIVSELLRLQGMPKDLDHSLSLNLDFHVSDFAKTDAFVDSVKRLMLGCGFYETYGYSFESDEETLCFCQDDSSLVKLKNPISHAFNTMRVTMFPGLLKQVKKNLSKQESNIRLFEIGHCFERQDGNILERMMLSCALTGSDVPESWFGSSSLGFFHAKSLLDYVLSSFRIQSSEKLIWKEDSIEGFHPHQGGQFYYAGRVIGTCGLLHPKLAKTYKIKEKIYFVSLDLDWLKTHIAEEKRYQQVSNQPMMRRDLSLVIPNDVSYELIKKEIDVNVKDNLKKVMVFDIYNGDQIPDGFYSMSIGLLFQDALRTLQDDDLAPVILKLMANLEKKLNIKPRGGS